MSAAKPHEELKQAVEALKAAGDKNPVLGAALTRLARVRADYDEVVDKVIDNIHFSKLKVWKDDERDSPEEIVEKLARTEEFQKIFGSGRGK